MLSANQPLGRLTLSAKEVCQVAPWQINAVCQVAPWQIDQVFNEKNVPQIRLIKQNAPQAGFFDEVLMGTLSC